MPVVYFCEMCSKKIIERPSHKRRFCSRKCHNTSPEHIARGIYLGSHYRNRNPGCTGHIMNKESRLKMRLSHLGKKLPLEQVEKIRLANIGRPNAGKFKKGLVHSKEMLEIMAKSRKKMNQRKEPTSIERKLYNELKRRGLLFEREYLVNNKFCVDVYVPSLNLLIEADGKYWHSFPKCIEKDIRANEYFKNCGYKLLRLSEDEINDGSFRSKLN